MKRKNMVLISSLVAMLLVLILLSTKLTTKTPNVTLFMTPKTASVFVDGKQARVANQKIYVPSGSRTITASQAGFSNYKKQITVKGSSELIIVLAPTTDEGYAFLNSNPSEILNREAVIGKGSTDTGVSIGKRNPVTSILPYIDQYFRIDYGASKAHPTDASAVAVYITVLAPGGKERALALLKQKGFDPASLEVIYREQ